MKAFSSSKSFVSRMKLCFLSHPDTDDKASRILTDGLQYQKAMERKQLMNAPNCKKTSKKQCESCNDNKHPERTLQQMAKDAQSTDVLGSYTGTPKDGGEPVQDADDL